MNFTSTHDLGMCTLAQEAACELQCTLISKHVAEYCRVAGTDDDLKVATASLMEYLGVLVTIPLISDLTRLVVKLHSVLSVNSGMSDEVINTQEIAKKELMVDKNHIFYKAISVLPTGIFAMAKAGAVFDQRAADKNFLLQLTSLEVMVQSMPPSVTAVADGAGGLTVSHINMFVDIRSKQAMILATSGEVKRARQLHGSLVILFGLVSLPSNHCSVGAAGGSLDSGSVRHSEFLLDVCF
jgi:hypothetical protein